MKHIYTLILTCCFAVAANAQVVFSSDLSSWNMNLPTDFVGSKTNINNDSIAEVMNGVIYGTSAVRLSNAQSGHRRFTTQPVNVIDGEIYDIEFWVRGQGEIRTGLFDGRSTGSGYAQYNSYETVSSNSWYKVTQSVSCAYDTTGGEFIFSTRNTVIGTGIEIDSVAISISGGNPPVAPSSIYAIQFTSDPSGDSPLLNTTVITGGVVSAVDSSGYYIQESPAAWSGIYIFDNNLPSIGDSVVLRGNVIEYFGLTEITNVDSFVVVGNFGAPVATNISLAQANSEDWEGILATVGGTCNDLPNQFDEWRITNGTDTLVVNDQFYAYTPVLGTDYGVTGPISYSFGRYRVNPRDINDVEIISSVEELLFPELTAFPNPANDVLFVNLGVNPGNAAYTIFDLSGRALVSSSLNQMNNTIETSSLVNGQYILRLAKDNAARNVVFMVQR